MPVLIMIRLSGPRTTDNRYIDQLKRGPWRRSRARPRCRTRSRSGRWSGCRRRRGWLVGEGAVETLEAAPAVGARESARGDIHRILPRYHRRGIEVEPYRRSTASAVRRDPVNRENARGGSRTDKAADVNGKISQLGKDNAVTGWLGTGRCTRRLTGRWRRAWRYSCS